MMITLDKKMLKHINLIEQSPVILFKFKLRESLDMSGNLISVNLMHPQFRQLHP